MFGARRRSVANGAVLIGDGESDEVVELQNAGVVSDRLLDRLADSLQRSGVSRCDRRDL